MRAIQAGYDHNNSETAIDRLIDRNDEELDHSLLAMKEFYGE